MSNKRKAAAQRAPVMLTEAEQAQLQRDIRHATDTLMKRIPRERQAPMTDDELKQWDTREVAVTLHDGRRLEGRFRVTPQPGLYHVFPVRPTTGAAVQADYSGQLEDLRTADFKSIEPL